jgi:hypothetical protein
LLLLGALGTAIFILAFFGQIEIGAWIFAAFLVANLGLMIGFSRRSALRKSQQRRKDRGDSSDTGWFLWAEIEYDPYGGSDGGGDGDGDGGGCGGD